MDYNLTFANRGRRRDQDGEHRQKGNRGNRATTATSKKKKKKSRKARIKAVLSPFSPSKLAKLEDQDHDQDQKLPQRKEEKIPDVHTMQAPLSVPVSPSTSSCSSFDEHDPSSREIYEPSLGISMSSTQRQHHLGQRLMGMTASISSRRASVDLPSIVRAAPPIACLQERTSTISAYLNVEGADEILDVTYDSLLRQDESDSFRICIQADDTTRSVRSQ